MRAAIALTLLAVACGDNRAAKDGGKDNPPPGTEPAPPIDSAPLPACATSSGTTVSTRRIAFGCGELGAPAAPKCLTRAGGDNSVLVTSPPNDGRLFVLERTGAIRIIENDVLADQPFLDLSPEASGPVDYANGEQGLLGLAFHPDYARNGKFYVDITMANPDTTDHHNAFLSAVLEYTGGLADSTKADPASGKLIIAVKHFAGNHNAGMIEFGSDGYLYISMGDGGNAGDPDRNGQNTHSLLAKILRIDVDHPSATAPYSIPPDNPFADGVAGAPEVWVYGLRNPWRWSFDRGTGDMWISDVGQNQIEELDVLPAGHQAGVNLGWSVYEGNRCCASAESDKCSQAAPLPCDPTGITMPTWQIEHAGTSWRAIIGGQVYRGTCYPDLVGTFLFADNSFSKLMAGKLQADGSLVTTQLVGNYPLHFTSIHADARGELYGTTMVGGVYHLEASP